MKIALIDTVKNPKFYPVSLLKLGAWRKSLGDDCTLSNTLLPDEADEIWITTVFTFDIPYSLAIVKEAKKRCNKVVVGGIAASLIPDAFESDGVEVFKGLHPEAENFHPDHSLLGKFPGYSISHTSRGCIRKCEFCMVKNLEPKFYFKPNWVDDIHPDSKNIVFYDNNWSAKPLKVMIEDGEKIESLRKSTKVRKVDFNQSLDCRVLSPDPEKIKLIASLPIDPLRFAFDNNAEEEPLKNVLRQFAALGRKPDCSIDMLYNFEEHPKEIYHRMESIVKLKEELHWRNMILFPMKFRPIHQISATPYVGRRWTKTMLKGYRKILTKTSTRSIVSLNNPEDFYYYYGKDENEFVALLNYPKLTSLLERKRGKVRWG